MFSSLVLARIHAIYKGELVVLICPLDDDRIVATTEVNRKVGDLGEVTAVGINPKPDRLPSDMTIVVAHVAHLPFVDFHPVRSYLAHPEFADNLDDIFRDSVLH
jgi:hypothetical protein